MGGGGGGSFRDVVNSTNGNYDTRTVSGQGTTYGGSSIQPSNSTYDHASRISAPRQNQNQNEMPNSTYDRLHIRSDIGEAGRPQHNHNARATVTQQPQPMVEEGRYASASHTQRGATTDHGVPFPSASISLPFPSAPTSIPTEEDMYASFEGNMDAVPQMRKLDEQGQARRPTVSTEDFRSIREIARAAVQQDQDQWAATAAPAQGRGMVGAAGGRSYEAPNPHMGMPMPPGGGGGGSLPRGGLYDRPEGHTGYEMANLHKDYEVANTHSGSTGTLPRQ